MCGPVRPAVTDDRDSDTTVEVRDSVHGRYDEMGHEAEGEGQGEVPERGHEIDYDEYIYWMARAAEGEPIPCKVTNVEVRDHRVHTPTMVLTYRMPWGQDDTATYGLPDGSGESDLEALAESVSISPYEYDSLEGMEIDGQWDATHRQVVFIDTDADTGAPSAGDGTGWVPSTPDPYHLLGAIVTLGLLDHALDISISALGIGGLFPVSPTVALFVGLLSIVCLFALFKAVIRN